MRLFASCGALTSVEEADRCSALATQLQSSMVVAMEYSLSVSSWKLGGVGEDGVVRDWSEDNAAGWSADPVIIRIGDNSPDDTKRVILHELGHKIKPKKLRDVTDADPTRTVTSSPNAPVTAYRKNSTSIMHWQTGGHCLCLRYLPRLLTHNNPGREEENQWEHFRS